MFKLRESDQCPLQSLLYMVFVWVFFFASVGLFKGYDRCEELRVGACYYENNFYRRLDCQSRARESCGQEHITPGVVFFIAAAACYFASLKECSLSSTWAYLSNRMQPPDLVALFERYRAAEPHEIHFNARVSGAMPVHPPPGAASVVNVAGKTFDVRETYEVGQVADATDDTEFQRLLEEGKRVQVQFVLSIIITQVHPGDMTAEEFNAREVAFIAATQQQYRRPQTCCGRPPRVAYTREVIPTFRSRVMLTDGHDDFLSLADKALFCLASLVGLSFPYRMILNHQMPIVTVHVVKELRSVRVKAAGCAPQV